MQAIGVLEVVIPNPHEEVEKLLNYSARKIRK